jgi:hypothetical protein
MYVYVYTQNTTPQGLGQVDQAESIPTHIGYIYIYIYIYMNIYIDDHRVLGLGQIDQAAPIPTIPTDTCMRMCIV